MNRMKQNRINQNFYSYFIIPIDSFDKIKLKGKNPFIICDIDNTLLYHIKSNENKSNETKECFFSRYFRDCFFLHCNDVFPTDMDGFRRFEERIKQLDGKLVFLSAIGENHIKTIESDFQKIGLDSKNYDIFFTTKKFSKGKFVNYFLRRFIHGDIIFIDDNIENHLSMIEYFPNAVHYLFDL